MKVKVSFCLPERMQIDIKQQLIKAGYNLKDKSRWVSEAIQYLFAVQSYEDFVKLNDEMHGFQKIDSVSIDLELKKQLDAAVLMVRRKYPIIEGVQSKILRTAIVQRLLRES